MFMKKNTNIWESNGVLEVESVSYNDTVVGADIDSIDCSVVVVEEVVISSAVGGALGS